VSSWLFPTTADAGMAVVAPSPATLLQDAAHGVQTYLMSSQAAKEVNSHLRHSGEWRVRSPHNPHDLGFLFLAWLDEILYRAEVHQQWLVESQLRIVTTDQGMELIAQVAWVDATLIEREIEIKAITTHDFELKFIEPDESVLSPYDGVPEFIGPCWYAQVVFDI